MQCYNTLSIFAIYLDMVVTVCKCLLQKGSQGKENIDESLFAWKQK